jgi:hypothetical protein
LPQLLADWFWPLQHYSAVNKTSFGYIPLDMATIHTIYTGTPLWLALLITGPWFVVPVLPLLAVLALIHWSVKAWWGSAATGRDHYYVLTSATLVGLVVSTLATGRHEFNHLVHLGPMLFLVLAWTLDGRDIRSSILHAARPVLVLLLLLSFTTYGMALLWQPLNSRQTVETRRGTLKTNRPDEVMAYLQAHVSPGESMLVYPYLPLYYYLTATRSPGRHEYLQPGLHSPQQFEELRSELVRDRTRVVLFEPAFREKTLAVWPSITAAELAAPDPVESYITTQYRACASLTTQNLWRFIFMIRKDLPCPVSPHDKR